MPDKKTNHLIVVFDRETSKREAYLAMDKIRKLKLDGVLSVIFKDGHLKTKPDIWIDDCKAHHFKIHP